MSTLKQLSDFSLSKFPGLAAALEIETVKTGARVEGLGCWLQTFRWSDGILMSIDSVHLSAIQSLT